MQLKKRVPQIQSAHAVLISGGNYILQLRDNKPTIAAGGQWSLFGGNINKGETALETVRREVYEELCIEPREFSYLRWADYYSSFERTVIRSWFFVSDVTALWPGHKLKEGRAAKAFQFKQLAVLDMPGVMYQTLEYFHRQREKTINRK
jgi:8-oxo-dGTP pyrophosphatase MutT (NUDIX family)